MKLSPLDIRHKEFQSALNGFNKGQVRDFLARAADQFEERLEQIQQLTEQIRKQEKEIEELRVSDIELKRTLVTSERLGSEVKLQAEREAELLLKETQSKADVIIRDAELQKRQLLKTAEMQIEEANSARQKAEAAAKQIRERSIQEAALQKKRASNMVAGLKEDLDTEAKHAQELAQLRTKSKTVISQLQKDIAKLKAERGQMVEQLGVYDRNLAELEQKVASKTELTQQPIPQKAKQANPITTSSKSVHPTQTKKQNSIQHTPNSQTLNLKTKQVATALSSSIDSLMSDSLLPESKLGLSSSAKLPKLSNLPKPPNLPRVLRGATASKDPDNPHDISYPNMDITLTDDINELGLVSKDLGNTDLEVSSTDPMNITVIPLDNQSGTPRETGRYSRERQLEREHLSGQQIQFVEDQPAGIQHNKVNSLSQHVYPPYPVKESSVQDRGRLITPPTVYDVENPFSNDGFDEIDNLGTFSESMLSKDTLSNNLPNNPSTNLGLRGAEFDSNIFDVEDTLELPTNKSTVEHIEVLDTDWFEKFELEDD